MKMNPSKLLITVLVSTFCLNAKATGFASTEKNYAGVYKGIYGGIRKGEFDLHLKPAEPQRLGDIEFYSKKTGLCTNVNNVGGMNSGYKTIYNMEPLVLKNQNRVDIITSTIFCENQWYMLVLELPPNAFSGGELSSKAAFYLQDRNFKIVLEKQIQLKKE